jgi:hypothetical protein
MTISEITRADLELIAHCNEPTSDQRLSALTSSVALKALDQFAQKQLQSGQIESDFYAQFQSGLSAWKSQVAEIECARKENKILIANLRFHGIDVGQYFTKRSEEAFKQFPFDGDIAIFRSKVQGTRLSLLLFCANKNLDATRDLINAFHLPDLNDLVKEAAQNNVAITVQLMKLMQIEDPLQLIELRELCIETDPLETLKNLAVFDEFDLNYRIQLATLCLQKEPVATAEFLPILPLPEEVKEKLYLDSLQRHPAALRFFPQELAPLNLTPFYATQGKELALATHLLAPMLGSIRTFLQSQQIGASPLFLERLQPVQQEPNESHSSYKQKQVQQMVWAQTVAACLVLSQRHLSKTSIEDFLQSDLIFSLADLPRSELHWPLMMQMIELGKHHNISYSQSFKNAWQQIFSVFIQAPFCKEVKDLLVKAGQSKFYKDGKNQIPLLELLLLLSESQTIDLASKRRLLKKMCQPLDKPDVTNTDLAAFGQNVYHLLTLVTMNIPAFCKGDTPQSLQELAKASFLSCVPLNDPDHFDENYANTFGKARSPAAFMLYAAKLKTLNNPELLEEFATFVNSVFDGSFQELRSMRVLSPHLQQIDENHSSILEKWFEKLPNLTHKQPPFVVIDSTDPIDLLLAGSEVGGSCQAVEGDPNLNKGLLGYLLDGKIRMLTIKAADGPNEKIIGRAMLKLLWDGSKPVLFLEQPYINRREAIYREKLIEMAQLKAQSLGVDLVIAGEKTTYKKLYSLGNPASYEYSDAAGGLYIDGRYSFHL